MVTSAVAYNYCHPGLHLIRGTGRAHTVLSFKQIVID